MDDVSVEPLWRRAGFFGALLWCTYAYFIPSPSWNPNSRFDLTLALVEQGVVHIDAYHDNTFDKAYYEGHHYSDKAPGVALLAVPAYAAFQALWTAAGGASPVVRVVGRDGVLGAHLAKGDGSDDVLLSPSFRWGQYVASIFTCGLAGACLGVMLMVTAAGHGRSVQDATAIAMSLALGTLVFPYSTSLYGHVPAAALAFCGFFLLRAKSRPHVATAFASGLAAAMAAACEWPAALLTAFIGVYTLTRFRRSKVCVAWAAGAVVPTMLVLAYNKVAFGSVFRLGYTHLESPEFSAGMASGFMGIAVPSPSRFVAVLFGRARGLVYTAPILLVATWGFFRPKSALRNTFLLSIFATVSFLLLCAGYFMWWGGAAMGPRHVISALPFWCLALVWVWPSAASPTWTGHAVFLCLALSVINMTLGTAVGLEAPMTSDVLFRYVYPLAVRGQFPYAPGASNIGRLLGLPGALSLLPLMLLWTTYIFWVWRLLPVTGGFSRKTKAKASTHE